MIIYVNESIIMLIVYIFHDDFWKALRIYAILCIESHITKKIDIEISFGDDDDGVREGDALMALV